jgi:hypothetical protein
LIKGQRPGVQRRECRRGSGTRTLRELWSEFGDGMTG